MNNGKIKRMTRLIVEAIIVESNGSDLNNYVKEEIEKLVNKLTWVKPYAKKILSYLPTLDISTLFTIDKFNVRRVAGIARKVMSNDMIRKAKQNLTVICNKLQTEYGVSRAAVENFAAVINAL